MTVADVDGDGILEPIILQDTDDGWQVWVWNLDAERTVQPTDYITDVDLAEVERLSAGDLDGDGRAEVVLLDDKGSSEPRRSFAGRVPEVSTAGDDVQVEVEYGRLLDIAVGDMDADGIAEVVVLDDLRRPFATNMSREFVFEERSFSRPRMPSFWLGPRWRFTSRRVGGGLEWSVVPVPIVLLYLPP